MMEISDRIKASRRSANLSQRKLAELSGLSQQMISKLESGHSKSSTGLISLAKALDVSPEWLWFGAEQTKEQTINACPFCDEKQLRTAWIALSEKQRKAFKNEIINTNSPVDSNHSA